MCVCASDFETKLNQGSSSYCSKPGVVLTMTTKQRATLVYIGITWYYREALEMGHSHRHVCLLCKSAALTKPFVIRSMSWSLAHMLAPWLCQCGSRKCRVSGQLKHSVGQSKRNRPLLAFRQFPTEWQTHFATRSADLELCVSAVQWVSFKVH